MTEEQLYRACKKAFDDAPPGDWMTAVIRVVQDDAAESQFPEVDPTRVEAMRLAAQWTERFEAISASPLLSIAQGIETYLRGGVAP